jgi:hypothetical protein
MLIPFVSVPDDTASTRAAAVRLQSRNVWLMGRVAEAWAEMLPDTWWMDPYPPVWLLVRIDTVWPPSVSRRRTCTCSCVMYACTPSGIRVTMCLNFEQSTYEFVFACILFFHGWALEFEIRSCELAELYVSLAKMLLWGSIIMSEVKSVYIYMHIYV